MPRPMPLAARVMSLGAWEESVAVRTMLLGVSAMLLAVSAISLATRAMSLVPELLLLQNGVGCKQNLASFVYTGARGGTRTDGYPSTLRQVSVARQVVV